MTKFGSLSRFLTPLNDQCMMSTVISDFKMASLTATTNLNTTHTEIREEAYYFIPAALVYVCVFPVVVSSRIRSQT